MTCAALGWAFLVTVGFGFAGAPTARAFYCDGGLVSVGDPEGEVRAVCGEPTTIATETITETHSSGVSPGHYVTTTTSRTVTIWTYDFGPRRLGERIVVERRLVTEIREPGYGAPRR